MTIEELNNIVSQYFLLADPSIIKFLLAVYVANKMTFLTPTWVFLVGASSGGKSSVLEPFKSLDATFFIDDMTANTLFSAFKAGKGVETSLVYMLPPNGLVIMTDFTMLLEKDEETAKKIMSQFRLIYDGKMKTFAGNAQNNDWEGRFGLVCGVTSAVYEKQQQYAAVGERMIYYVLDQPDRLKATEMAYKNMHKTEEIKQEIGAAYNQFMATIEIPQERQHIDEDVVRDLMALAEFATAARSSVSRNKFQRDRLIQVNFLEMPMRMFKQIMNVAQGLVVLNRGGLKPEDKRLLYKIALDSIPRTRMQVLVELTKYEHGDIAAIAASLKNEYETIKMTLQDLASLEIVNQRASHMQGQFYFALKNEYRELMAKFKNIEQTTESLEDQSNALVDDIGF